MRNGGPEAGRDRAEGLATIRSFLDVSRETEARLDVYADELARWNRTKNLVGPDTLARLWTRHVADSAQVLAAVPEATRFVDLGSGAGLPGLVLAILVTGSPDAEVQLVESNSGKCAFLRAAIRKTGAPAIVHRERIERLVPHWSEPVDVITARALAPLGALLEMAAPLIHRGAIGVFHKGQDVERELTEASTYWKLTCELVPSRTKEGAALVVVRHCERRRADAARESGDDA